MLTGQYNIKLFY